MDPSNPAVPNQTQLATPNVTITQPIISPTIKPKNKFKLFVILGILILVIFTIIGLFLFVKSSKQPKRAPNFTSRTTNLASEERKVAGIDENGKLSPERASELALINPQGYQHLALRGLIASPSTQEKATAKPTPPTSKSVIDEIKNFFLKLLGKLTFNLINTAYAQQARYAITTPNVTFCGDLVKSGNYTLSKDLEIDNGVCIYADHIANVNLDCQNHKIKVNDSSGIQLESVTNFSIKNCILETSNSVNNVIYVNKSDSGIVESNTIQGGRIGYNQQNSSHIKITNNHLVSDHITDRISPIALNSGNDNVISDNILDGQWDGTNKDTKNQLGGDDGIVISSESKDTITNNTISNVFDCGIETLGLVQDSQISNNNIANAGLCGIGGWYSNSWVNNTINSNTINDSAYLFYLNNQYSGVMNEDWNVNSGSDGPIYFTGNKFGANSFSNQKSSSYLGDTHNYSSNIDLQHIPSNINPSEVQLSDNSFENNNLGTVNPVIFPPSMAINNGGNICSKSNEDAEPTGSECLGYDSKLELSINGNSNNDLPVGEKEEVNLAAKLFNQAIDPNKGCPVTESEIVFKINDQIVGKGLACQAIKYTLPSQPGEYTLSAEFPGQNLITATEGSLQFKVISSPTSAPSTSEDRSGLDSAPSAGNPGNVGIGTTLPNEQGRQTTFSPTVKSGEQIPVEEETSTEQSNHTENNSLTSPLAKDQAVCTSEAEGNRAVRFKATSLQPGSHYIFKGSTVIDFPEGSNRTADSAGTVTASTLVPLLPRTFTLYDSENKVVCTSEYASIDPNYMDSLTTRCKGNQACLDKIAPAAGCFGGTSTLSVQDAEAKVDACMPFPNEDSANKSDDAGNHDAAATNPQSAQGASDQAHVVKIKVNGEEVDLDNPHFSAPVDGQPVHVEVFYSDDPEENNPESITFTFNKPEQVQSGNPDQGTSGGTDTNSPGDTNGGQDNVTPTDQGNDGNPTDNNNVDSAQQCVSECGKNQGQGCKDQNAATSACSAYWGAGSYCDFNGTGDSDKGDGCIGGTGGAGLQEDQSAQEPPADASGDSGNNNSSPITECGQAGQTQEEQDAYCVQYYRPDNTCNPNGTGRGCSFVP